MGGVGIWCMHFIGNRAIVLGDGNSSIQIAYNVTFTGVSFVLPVCVVLTAFYAIGFEEKAGYIRIIFGGFLTGASVCGMHYVGQLGIANYHCTYKAGYVVGAAIIAAFSSTAALSIFFRWRATWTNSWWRRGICSGLLAMAVSGMHWTATVGTAYLKPTNHIKHNSQLSRGQIVTICAVLSCTSCAVLTACAIIAGDNRRRSSTRARQLVLGCAFFDPKGRIMVTPQALLPSLKIADHYVGRTFKDDDLTRTHPAFLWAFRASRHWNLIKDLVPSMKNRLQSDEDLAHRYISSKGCVTDEETELETDFDTLFKQLFCVTAQELSDQLHVPLPDLGILYDDVLVSSSTTSFLSRAIGKRPSVTRKGQMLFTIRQLDKQESSRLEASGYRFAPVEHIVPALSRGIHVSSASLDSHIRDMRDYATTERSFEPGVHLISFVMRPTVNDNFEILTARGTRNPLPSASLPMKSLKAQHMRVILRMTGWTMPTCVNWLESRCAAEAYGETDNFRGLMGEAIEALSASLPPDINSVLRFSGRVLFAPSRSSNGRPCTLLAFCAVSNLDTRVSNSNYTFTPFSVFRAEQQMHDQSIGRDLFARDLAKEIIHTNAAPSTTSTDSSPSLTIRALSRFLPSKRLRNLTGTNRAGSSASSVSEESLVTPSRFPLGDITVFKEVRVDVAHMDEAMVHSSQKQGSQTVVAAGDIVSSGTYVDELYSLCCSPGARFLPDSIFQGTNTPARPPSK
ncbi:hypothetical protein MPDQ_006152 [Monascus purpureus]|uniref:MHYT domain-containing protein n=1 Tax=Monascus purpureus TaxID=5098 RepID=A0A507R5U5_MONPU|nr:hypothetical protein MPDQ_006152 [Monascus purpureus]BDD62741.1 hypothetical protein MAP00_007703 [Monascus purpureus]